MKKEYLNEIWKPIKGYEGLYEVSNFGRIKSIRFGKEKIMKLQLKKNNYLDISLTKDGKTKRFLIHRLVAEAFIPNPDNLPEVNHKDECKTNNNVNNLEWCDRVYNINYGTCIERRSKKRGRSVDVFKNDIFIETITSANLCAKKYKTTQSIIYRCCNKGYFCKKRQKWVNVSKYKEYNFKWHNEE